MSTGQRVSSARQPLPIMKIEMELGSDLVPLLSEIENSGVHANFGKQVEIMEAEFARLIGETRPQVVSVANATLGLQGAMSMFKPPSWVIPSWTFAATAHAAQLQPVDFYFGDILENNWALNPAEVLEGEGAVVTAPFGASLEIGKEWNHVSSLVIDGAAAIGAFPTILESFDRPWAVVISLHATKLLGIGEGGLVVFKDEGLAKRFRQWTNFGFWGSREAEFPATNAKLSEVAAAICRFRLEKWKSEKDDWRTLRSKVHRVGDTLGINPPFSSKHWVSPYWIVQFEDGHAKARARQELRNSAIESRDWWLGGCHEMQAFRSIPVRSTLDRTKELASRSLGLPYFRSISDLELEMVSGALDKTLRSG